MLIADVEEIARHVGLLSLFYAKLHRGWGFHGRSSEMAAISKRWR
jgi:hypothetical protein